MKSKSFDLKGAPTEKGSRNRSFDFINLYETASETNAKLQRKSVDHLSEDNVGTSSSVTPRSGTEYRKKNKANNGVVPLEVGVIKVDRRSLSVGARWSPSSDTKVTSTPNSSKKTTTQAPKVKSIMKSSVRTDDEMDGSGCETPTNAKKRNKSVSFMLDDTEEVAVKKVKSDESLKSDNPRKLKLKHKLDERKRIKKLKKKALSEKENNAQMNIDTDQGDKGQESSRKLKSKPVLVDAAGDSPASGSPVYIPEKRKKVKKIKKRKKSDEGSEPTENESNNNDEGLSEHKTKKLKKKKRSAKTVPQPDNTETDGEPVTKSRKKDVKPEVIAADLENLTIGDNPHTLTNLLDEMTVVDKNKKKKNKLRRKTKTVSASSSETADLEKIEEGKEKVKWKKRKWNKDRKGGVDEEHLLNTVIVDNLPLHIMLTYKTLLGHHFGSIGLVKNIGIAEVYPTEEPKMVFTTTVTFYSEASATQALQEDNTEFEGARIRVSRPLPATQTTLVVRSYGELTDQTLSSAFAAAGRVRSIRLLVKGRKAMATAFVEFDGPESVERAIKMAAEGRVGGKKLHVSRFEPRREKGEKSPKSAVAGNPDSENEGDSENSND